MAKRKDDKKLSKEIIRKAKQKLNDLEPDSKEAKAIAEFIKEFKEADKADSIIDWKIWAPVVSSILGILIICSFEQLKCLTSKALTLVIKPKS